MAQFPTTPSGVRAWLGPTNTGKTYAAIEAMLRHPTGIIGLPLRLLAREVYDGLTARIGEARVALVTGEEQRIGRRADYWICTVEAMPLGRPVAFLAVDEIQLAGDANRGHVFTDRLLHARGTEETVFLGAETIGPLLRRLLPGIHVERFARRSALAHAGALPLGRLPGRTAVVAFRTTDVYALAERIRRRHGGAAVVMGALSPRTRNAQVALYQSGEVPMLVATDAIGMGLNMDIDLVAFADLRKFDGRRHRDLGAAELAQVAGRAGRNRNDGRFATTAESPDLSPRQVEALTNHRFAPLRRLWWRASALDTHSLEGLLRTLATPPPRRELVRAGREEDEEALRALAALPAIRERAQGREQVELLWEVCRIPDYRKLGDNSHARMLAGLFRRLVAHGQLDGGWLRHRIDRLDRMDGALEQLTTRLAFIRTWTYITHRPGWADDAAGLAERARAVEERLGDALHEGLAARFVDRRSLAVSSGAATEVEGDAVRVGGHSVGALVGLQFSPAPGVDASNLGVGPELREALLARVQEVIAAAHAAFALGEDLTVRWRGQPLGRLVRGQDLLSPNVRLAPDALLGAGALTQIQRRMQAWSKDWVDAAFAPLREADLPRGAPRGLAYALERGLGLAPAASVRTIVDALGGDGRRAVARAGIRLGAHHAYSMPMLDRAAEMGALYAAWSGLDRIPAAVSPPHAEAFTDEVWRALGHVSIGGVAVRVDVWEEISAALRAAERRGARIDPVGILAEGLRDADWRSLLHEAGFREQAEGWVPTRGRPRGRKRRSDVGNALYLPSTAGRRGQID